MDIDLPEYHQEGVGCGLEDRNITDRYEACEYGFNEAVERCQLECIAPLEDRIKELEKEVSKLSRVTEIKQE